MVDDGSGDDNDSDEVDGEDEEVFEVEKILGICYGDPQRDKKHANYILRYLNFKPKFKVICGNEVQFCQHRCTMTYLCSQL